jgi:hypothetical protein
MNYPQQSAQGLASLGRGNDSMLVHMTPNEVQGLQGLAMAHGGSLSINPQTGLPEAGILDIVLPVAGSFFGLPPEVTAALMAGKTLIEGGDIGSAALSAFGGYTGGKFGKSLKSFVDPIQSLPTSAVNAAANTANTAGSFIGSTGEMGSKLLSPSGGASQIGSNLGSVTNEFGVNRPVEDVFKKSFSPDYAKQNFVPGFADNNIQGSFMGKDVGAQGMFQPGGGNTLQTTGTPTYGANVGAGTDIGSTISEGARDFGNQFGAAVKNPIDFARHVGEGDALAGGAKLGMYAASPFVEDMLKPPQFSFTDPEKGKWRSETGGLSFDPKYSTGLTLLPNLNQPITAKEGGYIDSYAMGGVVGNPSVGGGLSDLYNRPEGQASEIISQDGYGIGRLNNLGGEQARYQAQVLGYASGGYLNGQGDGMSDSIPATIEGKQPARLADGEFVVPADVVSHLGNGSSKAGSKRLYKMLDKVRRARTGHTKQGKQIKADKYLPA